MRHGNLLNLEIPLFDRKILPLWKGTWFQCVFSMKRASITRLPRHFPPPRRVCENPGYRCFNTRPKLLTKLGDESPKRVQAFALEVPKKWESAFLRHEDSSTYRSRILERLKLRK